MSGETVITVIGNLTADPELRFTPSGSAVANFTIASTPRVFDKASNEWKDGEALFLRSAVWNEQAENAAETLTKGMRVIAQGRLRARSYDTKEGEKRTVMELEIDEVGPSLRFAAAVVTRTQRSGGGQVGQGGRGQGGGFANTHAPQQGGGGYQNQPQQRQQQNGGGGYNNPQQQPQQGGGGGWGNPPQRNDEPPF